MKKFLLILLLWSGGDSAPGPLSQAGKAVLDENYEEAITAYELALDLYPERAVEISFNLGILYARLDSPAKAAAAFRLCLGKEEVNPLLASEASNNYGVALVEINQPIQALELFRKAMRLNPNNQVARMNYELLSRLLPPPKSNTAPPASEPEQNDSTPPPVSEEGAGNIDEEYIQRIEERLRRWRKFVGTSDASRTEPYEQISLEQAQRILEEMRSNEARFLQQLRKSPSTIAPASERPDW